jgi:hypothetical protein
MENSGYKFSIGSLSYYGIATDLCMHVESGDNVIGLGVVEFDSSFSLTDVTPMYLVVSG